MFADTWFNPQPSFSRSRAWAPDGRQDLLKVTVLEAGGNQNPSLFTAIP